MICSCNLVEAFDVGTTYRIFSAFSFVQATVVCVQDTWGDVYFRDVKGCFSNFHLVVRITV